MKTLNILKFVVVIGLFAAFAGCSEDVTDFGLTGQVSGTVKDEAGVIVAGDAATNVVVVNALGEGDKTAMLIRVKADGTYQNTKLFPKKYKLWLSGPVTSIGFDTIRVDFGAQSVYKQDMTANPYVYATVKASNVTSTSVTFDYTITSDGVHGIKSREIYCSNVPSPTTSLGAGAFYDTKKKSLTANTGSITYTDLTPGTKYFVRIGALASTGTTIWNYSEQIVVDTPK